MSIVFADFLHPEGVDLRRPDEVYKLLPEAIAITDCKSLYDALEKNESLGLGLSEKRTSIEVMATKQQMRATGLKTKWVNSDRQLADVLTKAPHPGRYLENSKFWTLENCLGRKLHLSQEHPESQAGLPLQKGREPYGW